MNTLRLGLIGFGGIGEIRARALARTPGCELKYVYDTDPQRLRAAAAHAEPMADLERLVDAPDCDAVIVSTRPDTHERLALAAIRAGKHVLIEKPMANSPEGCAAIVAAAAQRGVKVACGFNFRYFEAFQALKRAVQQNQIGPLRYVNGYAGHTGLTELRSPWMYDRAIMGGGTLMDNGIHLIDMVQWLMGPATEVNAVQSAPVWDVGVEETAFVQLRGAGPVVATLHSSWTAWKGYKFAVEAFGESGMAVASYAPLYFRLVQVERTPRFVRRSVSQFYPGTIVREKLRGWQDTAIRAFVDEFTEFRRLVAGDPEPLSIATGLDGQRAVQVAFAAQRSVIEHRRIELPGRAT